MLNNNDWLLFKLHSICMHYMVFDNLLFSQSASAKPIARLYFANKKYTMHFPRHYSAYDAVLNKKRKTVVSGLVKISAELWEKSWNSGFVNILQELYVSPTRHVVTVNVILWGIAVLSFGFTLFCAFVRACVCLMHVVWPSLEHLSDQSDIRVISDISWLYARNVFFNSL